MRPRWLRRPRLRSRSEYRLSRSARPAPMGSPGRHVCPGRCSMMPRCPERINIGRGVLSRRHRPPGHRLPCHTAGRTWYPSGDAGQRVRYAGCFPDCLPLPSPPQTAARNRRTPGG
jgi:hypothetical protein